MYNYMYTYSFFIICTARMETKFSYSCPYEYLVETWARLEQSYT